MSMAARQRSSMTGDLAAAIDRNELTLVYQCIVDLPTSQVVGCEALLRWKHANCKSISPSVFIPIAEKSGSIVPIGKWVLREASRAAASWPCDMTVAVNLSTRQLRSLAIAEEIIDIVADTGLSLDRLELEITESCVARDDFVADTVLGMLRERGVRIALDDFGTGYSSMAQLSKLPVDRIKLDRSFVAGLTGDNSNKSISIVSSLIYLARMMNLAVTAEGVESALELKHLHELGCESAQGFYFAEPMEESALLAFLHECHGVISSPRCRLESRMNPNLSSAVFA